MTRYEQLMRRCVNVWEVAMLVWLASCGCRTTMSPAVVDATRSNERSLASAMSVAGLTNVQVESQRAEAQAVTLPVVTTPTVVAAPNDASKHVVVFPAAETPPAIVRDASGNLHELVVRHDVVATRGDRICGCGPHAPSGTAPPPPPIWYVALDNATWAEPVTITAREWIDIGDSYPESGDSLCRQVP